MNYAFTNALVGKQKLIIMTCVERNKAWKTSSTTRCCDGFKDRQQQAVGDVHCFSVFPVYSEAMVLITVQFISYERSDLSLSYDMNDVVIE